MGSVPIHLAKAHLSDLVDRARRGEEIVISRRNQPLVRLVPIDQKAPGRQFGALAGQVWMDDAFFEPLPDAEIAAWEGEG